jgi:hypothetical protein
MKVLRFVVALAAIPLAATIVAAGPLEARSASAAPVTLVKCRLMQSNSLISTVELSDCNHPRITGGSGTTDGLGNGPYPLTWSSMKETNYSLVSSSSPSQSRCPNSAPELDFVGSISYVVGPWTKRFLGAPVAFDICLGGGDGAIELVPGTVFTMTVPKP